MVTVCIEADLFVSCIWKDLAEKKFLSGLVGSEEENEGRKEKSHINALLLSFWGMCVCVWCWTGRQIRHIMRRWEAWWKQTSADNRTACKLVFKWGNQEAASHWKAAATQKKKKINSALGGEFGHVALQAEQCQDTTVQFMARLFLEAFYGKEQFKVC